jgi:hypothetical protein
MMSNHPQPEAKGKISPSPTFITLDPITGPLRPEADICSAVIIVPNYFFPFRFGRRHGLVKPSVF